MTDKVRIFEDENGEWRWHRKSENGKIVSNSGEGYEAKSFTIRMARELNIGDVEFEIQTGPGEFEPETSGESS